MIKYVSFQTPPLFSFLLPPDLCLVGKVKLAWLNVPFFHRFPSSVVPSFPPLVVFRLRSVPPPDTFHFLPEAGIPAVRLPLATQLVLRRI